MNLNAVARIRCMLGRSAVMRQGSAIEQMRSIAWIHPPVVDATPHRRVFLRSEQDSRATIAVPALDIDVAW